MHFFSKLLLHALALLTLSLAGGCCCCDMSALRNLSAPGGTTQPGLSPQDAADRDNGILHAQNALNKKGYGEILTADLRKDGAYWYVEGTAVGKEGGNVNYLVMFEVAQFDNTQRWNVNTVSINGETVYP